MTAPSIQLAASMSAETIASSVHAFATSVGAGASFAEHLDRAVQSSPRPASRLQTQPSDSRSTTPRPASDAVQTPRTQSPAGRPAAPQTKQSSGVGSKTKARTLPPVQKDAQRQPTGVPGRDSRLSDNSRNSGRRQAGDEETPAKDKSPFAQAVAQSAASQPVSTASSATQPADTSTQPSDASIHAALLALLQAAQNPAQTVAVQPETTTDGDLNAVQTDSNSTDAESATLSSLLQSLNFSTSNAAYLAALASFQASASAGSANSPSPADQQTSPLSSESAAASTESSTPASQATSQNSNSVPPSASVPQVDASAVSAASTANAVAVAAPASQAANTSPVASTAAPASQANATASAAHAMSSTNGQQAETEPAPAVKPPAESADPTNFIKNLKSDAGQHEVAKPALEALTAAAKAKAEPLTAELQQAIASVTVTNHVSSPALSRPASANDSQSPTAGQDSGSPAISATQGSAGWTDDSTGDSAEDYTSTQASRAFQGSNGSKSSGSAVEFLPSSAFNSDAVSGVATTAVHAIAAGTLQSNTSLENASFKTPEAAAQNLNAAAQEKAFAAWQSVSAQIGRVVNTATLNALQNGTEMRVQLRTDAFGSMDIRATLEGGKVGAAIGVESAEAHNALLSQLPALQQSLNERQVQLDQVSVVSSYAQSGTDFGTGSGKHNGDPTPSSGYHQQASGHEQVPEPVSAPVTETWQPATSRGRLSVRA